MTKGTYELEEFDGTLSRTYAGNRLKKFVRRNKIHNPVSINVDTESKKGREAEQDKSAPGLFLEVGEDSASESGSDNDSDVVMTTALEPAAKDFEIIPPVLAAEQRRQYVRYEEGDEGDLL